MRLLRERWGGGLSYYLNPAMIAQKAVTMPVLLSPWTRSWTWFRIYDFRVSWDAETSSAWHFYRWLEVTPLIERQLREGSVYWSLRAPDKWAAISDSRRCFVLPAILPLIAIWFLPINGNSVHKGWRTESFDWERGKFEILNPKYKTITKTSNSNDQNRLWRKRSWRTNGMFRTLEYSSLEFVSNFVLQNSNFFAHAPHAVVCPRCPAINLWDMVSIAIRRLPHNINK